MNWKKRPREGWIRIGKFFNKKRFIWLVVFVTIPLMIYLFRFPIMRGMADYLIVEDKLEKADVIFVLGGGALERGNEAVKIYEEGYAPLILCTSENILSTFEIMDTTLTEAALTRHNIIKQNVPAEKVIAYEKATSTFEEAEILLDYALENDFVKVIIITSNFHTRRVSWVFKDKFEEKGIKIILRGAGDIDYQESRWWESEEGMIMLNNEYMKLLYYLYKY